MSKLPGATLRRGLPALSLLILALSLAFTSRTQAHSYLVQSDPPDNSVLSGPPAEVRLWFSEPVAAGLGAIQVLDQNGVPVQTLSSGVDAADPTQMSAKLPPLPPGVYTVTWTTLSAQDGHAERGFIVFSIGENAPGVVRRGGGSSTIVSALPDAALHGLNYLGLMLAVGCLGVLLFVLRPPAGEAATVYPAARRRVWVLLALAAELAFAAGLAQIAWQARLLADNQPGQASFPALAGQLIEQWPWGYAWIGRELAWLGCLAAAIWGWRLELDALRPQPRPSAQVAVAAAAALTTIAVLAQAVASHAAALDAPALPILVDAVHLAAAGLWVGGLAALVVSLLPLLRRNRTAFTRLTRQTWSPFSRLAALSVGLLLASGVYATAREVISPDALMLSPYGRTLAIKIAIFLLAGLAGLFNSMMLHPRLAEMLQQRLRLPVSRLTLRRGRFSDLVTAEASLGLLIIALAGLLTSLPPAEDRAYAFSPHDQPAEISQPVDDLLVQFAVQPNRPGANLINIRITNTRQTPPAETLRVIVRMRYREQDTGEVSQDAEPMQTMDMDMGGAGDTAGDLAQEYHLSTRSLSQPGPWSIDVIVRRKGLPDSHLAATWTVLPAKDLGPVLVSRRAWRPALEAASGIITVLVLAAALLVTRTSVISASPRRPRFRRNSAR